METHPIIVAAIIKCAIEYINPFDRLNAALGNISARLVLRMRNYTFNSYLSFEDRYVNALDLYEKRLRLTNMEFTSWIEFFSEELSYAASNIKEKIQLLARDTKIAKVSGRVKLTDRQEKIVEYLQDYGILQNKDFPTVFPNVSEDSVLRDLKVLLNQGMVVKTGSTKSSRYELN